MKKWVCVWEVFVVFVALDIVCHAAMGVELGSQMQNPASLQYVQNRAAVRKVNNCDLKAHFNFSFRMNRN